jgi:hypothetical protein
MAGHDDERLNAPRTATRGTTEVFQQPITIDIIAHDVLAAVASGHEMADGARIPDLQLAESILRLGHAPFHTAP